MENNINAQAQFGVGSSLANVVSLQAYSANRPATTAGPGAGRVGRHVPTTFDRGMPMETVSVATMANVRSVARRHPSLETALAPMVRAAGLHGPQAEAAVAAIKSNPHLMDQALRAFQASNR